MLLGFILTLTDSGESEPAASSSPEIAAASSPSPDESPTSDADDPRKAQVDAAQEEYGFYPGPAEERYYEAIAFAFIQEDCDSLAAIQDYWENPSTSGSQPTLDQMNDGAQEDLVANALRARLLLNCSGI